LVYLCEKICPEIEPKVANFETYVSDHLDAMHHPDWILLLVAGKELKNHFKGKV
jgi:hypothetical protein